MLKQKTNFSLPAGWQEYVAIKTKQLKLL